MTYRCGGPGGLGGDQDQDQDVLAAYILWTIHAFLALEQSLALGLEVEVAAEVQVRRRN